MWLRCVQWLCAFCTALLRNSISNTLCGQYWKRLWNTACDFFLVVFLSVDYGCNHNDVTQTINYLSNPVSEPHSYHVSTFYVQSTLDLNKCFNTFGNMLIHSLASVVGLTLQLPRKVAKQIISTLGHTNNLGGVQSIDRAVLLKLLSVSNIMKK